ncbi:MAG: hypothetical protein R3C97_17615 [Geminicoccaceae bacterium]
MDFEQRIAIHRELISGGLTGEREEVLVDRFCRMLGEVGVPITRFFAGSNILHPLHDGRMLLWENGCCTATGSVIFEYDEND